MNTHATPENQGDLRLPASPLSLDRYINPDELRGLISRAMAEDLGPAGLDLTSRSMISGDKACRAVVRSRGPGQLAGGAMLPLIAAVYDSAIRAELLIKDGQRLAAGDVVADLVGPLRAVLAMERVVLNFMTHLSGIATLTARYVAEVAATKAEIYDTRKTLPGLRALQKYAVACGGGHNHRFGLYDAVLIKDNHIAHLSPADLPDAIKRAAEQALAKTPDVSQIEIEVDTLDQLDQVLRYVCPPVTIVLLDNMAPDQLGDAVGLRDRIAPSVLLEASGGINLSNVAEIAQTGVDRIAVGAITHSAPALDLGMDIT